MDGKPTFLTKNIGLVFAVAVVALIFTYAYLLFIRPAHNIAWGGAESTTITSQDDWGESMIRSRVDLSTTSGSVKLDLENLAFGQAGTHIHVADNGDVYTQWLDNRDGTGDEYMQRFDTNGVKRWVGDKDFNLNYSSFFFDGNDNIYMKASNRIYIYDSDGVADTDFAAGNCDNGAGGTSNPGRWGVADSGNIYCLTISNDTVTSLDSFGTERFSKNLWGGANVQPYHIYVAENDYFYTKSKHYDAPLGSYFEKWDSDGGLVWSHLITDPNEAYLNYVESFFHGVGVDNSGDVWFGWSKNMDKDHPLCDGVSNCYRDYVTGIDSDTGAEITTYLFGEYYTGSSYGEYAQNLAFDESGNAYYLRGCGDAAGCGAEYPNLYLKKYSTAGSLQWSTTIVSDTKVGEYGPNEPWLDIKNGSAWIVWDSIENRTNSSDVLIQKIRASDGQIMLTEENPIINSDKSTAYFTSGTHTTADTQIDGTADLSSWDDFTPAQTTPANTSVNYQFRTSTDAATWGAWTVAAEYSGTPLDLSGLSVERYMQVKATLATSDTAVTPQIDDYTINFSVPSLCDDFSSLNISPSSVTLNSGGSTAITATPVDVGGTSLPAISVSYGTDCGSITAIGAYTAPTVTAQTTCTVTATSDCGGSATSTITVNPPDDPVCNNNGIQDNGETGIDCGGGNCPDCPVPPPPCNYNGVKDNGETGIDCGGGNCPDCLTPPPPCNYNGVKDNGETGVDCGGGECPACPDCTDLITVFYSPERIIPSVEKDDEYYLFLTEEELEKWTSKELKLNIKAASVLPSTYYSYVREGTWELENGSLPGVVRLIDPTTFTISPETIGSFNQDGLLDINYNLYPTQYNFDLGANSPICSIEATLHILPDAIHCPDPPCYSGIILDIPNGDETWFLGTIEEILWHYLNIEEIVDHLRLELSLDSGETYSYIINSKITGDASDQAREYEKINQEEENEDEWKEDEEDDSSSDTTTDTDNEEPISDPNGPATQNPDLQSSSSGSHNSSSNIYALAADSLPINYYWDIPLDDALLSKTAKIKVIAYDKLGRVIDADESDEDFEIGKSLLASVFSYLDKYIDIISKSLLSLAVLSALLSYIGPFLNSLRGFLLFGKKKRTSLGTVYSATSGEPKQQASVLLFDSKSNRLLKTDTTDSDGHFSFTLAPGSYYIKLKDKESTIANNLSQTSKRSLFYGDNYFGGTFTISDNIDLNQKDNLDEHQTSYNIPTITKNEVDYRSLSLLNIKNKFLKFLIYLDWPLLIVGTLFSLLAILKNPDILNILIIATYLFLWARHFITRPIARSFGVAIDEDTKQPIPLAIVRALDYNTHKLVQTSVTNRAGHFTLNLQKGRYSMAVQKHGYLNLEPLSVEVKKGMNKSIEANLYLKSCNKTDADLKENIDPNQPGRSAKSSSDIIKGYSGKIGR